MPDLLLGIYAYLKKHATHRRALEKKKLWMANKTVKALATKQDGSSKTEAGYLSNSNESIENETVGPYSEHKNITCNDECMTSISLFRRTPQSMVHLLLNIASWLTTRSRSLRA